MAIRSNRALRDARRYELILLDTFDGDYIPEHLMTLEYLVQARQLLAPRERSRRQYVLHQSTL